jgi:hypothetical protein
MTWYWCTCVFFCLFFFVYSCIFFFLLLYYICLIYLVLFICLFVYSIYLITNSLIYVFFIKLSSPTLVFFSNVKCFLSCFRYSPPCCAAHRISPAPGKPNFVPEPDSGPDDDSGPEPWRPQVAKLSLSWCAMLALAPKVATSKAAAPRCGGGGGCGVSGLDEQEGTIDQISGHGRGDCGSSVGTRHVSQAAKIWRDGRCTTCGWHAMVCAVPTPIRPRVPTAVHTMRSPTDPCRLRGRGRIQAHGCARNRRRRSSGRGWRLIMSAQGTAWHVTGPRPTRRWPACVGWFSCAREYVHTCINYFTHAWA